MKKILLLFIVLLVVGCISISVKYSKSEMVISGVEQSTPGVCKYKVQIDSDTSKTLLGSDIVIFHDDCNLFQVGDVVKFVKQPKENKDKK